MKKLTIQFNGTTTQAKSEANMWNILREIRNGLTEVNEDTPHATVTEDETGNTFKDIVFKRNSTGKIEMINLIKETCRRQVEKARKAAAEKAAKEEERKTRKREADRRYRARKKAEKEAQMAAETAEEAALQNPEVKNEVAQEA